MQDTSKHIKFVKYNLIKPTTAGQIKVKENNKIKLPNKCKAQNRIYDMIFTSRKKLKEEQETVLIHDLIFMNKKKNRKTHYQRGEHEVVEELTLDRQERRVEDTTRKETVCRRR